MLVFDLFSAITEVRWLAVACRLNWWREPDKEPPCGEAGDLAIAIRGYIASDSTASSCSTRQFGNMCAPKLCKRSL
jgi:hypothetical protein